MRALGIQNDPKWSQVGPKSLPKEPNMSPKRVKICKKHVLGEFMGRQALEMAETGFAWLLGGGGLLWGFLKILLID